MNYSVLMEMCHRFAEFEVKYYQMGSKDLGAIQRYLKFVKAWMKEEFAHS